MPTPDGKWSAWERKRGALLELARLVLDRPGALQCAAGDAAGLSGTVYLLTLDADTRLTPGAARVGAMLLPAQPRRGGRAARRGHATASCFPRPCRPTALARAPPPTRRCSPGPPRPTPRRGAREWGRTSVPPSASPASPATAPARLRLLRRQGHPEGRVLSHDALEGAYLHGGFLGDVELTDTFPQPRWPGRARAHRWIRGDWQNAPWIFGQRGRALHPIDRFRLADSLRRPLVAPATWISIFLGCVLRWPGLRLAAYAALLALAQGLIRALGQPIVHPADTRVRYHSDVLHGLASAVAQTVLRLILLPWEAVLNASAIVTALWRMLVSHKNLLQWQTAAQRAGKRDGLGAYWRALWPASALGLLTAVLTPSPTGLAAGIVGAPVPSCWRRSARRIRPGLRRYRAPRSASCWAGRRRRGSIFETFCTAEDHYLPPDNVQLQPPTGTAHRTSPTNMGLALVSALGAHALGIDNGRGLELAERMLTTMEQLPRWNGHFYNWYHTCTLRPMPPLYVSTVDSGNWPPPCSGGKRPARLGADELAARAQQLCDGMDFGPLYDPQRRLMHIGIDTGSGKVVGELLRPAGKRGTADVVLRRGAGRRAARALARPVARAGGPPPRLRVVVGVDVRVPDAGAVSAAGARLPAVESAKFCLYVQRRRVRPGQVWGVSESALLRARQRAELPLKAHGCAALALQPGMDKELVLSPYSSFLALAVEPRGDRNLRKLAALGLLGQHGFFDAL